MRSALALAAVTVTVSVLLSGCVPQGPEVTPPPESSTAPIFASDEEALAAATEAYEAYLAMSDLIAQEGGVNPERIESVAARNALADALEGFTVFRERGYRSTGGSLLGPVKLQQYSEEVSGTVDVMAMYACLDVSNVDVVDTNGSSVVEATRPDIQFFEVTFDLVDTDSGELIVSSREPWAGEHSCD